MAPTISSDSERTKGGGATAARRAGTSPTSNHSSNSANCRDYALLIGWPYPEAALPIRRPRAMHAPQRHAKALNWTALLTAILLVAPFVRALWQMLQAGETTWLPANGDALLFGAVIAAVLIGDSLRFGRPSRAFLLILAT